ncbi:hypothetical protein BU17DRAFT_52834 [Hysterangium stoloniferum]|nr:hypothetical protein BU17DRAFT_52834 [Hysterangium stoloniferum]
MRSFFRALPTLTRATTRPLLPITRIARITHPRISTTPTSFLRSFASSRIRHTTSPSPTTPEPPQNLSGRLKSLIKSYGWYALGVYVVISTLDFGVAFAAINLLGADYVSSVTSAAKSFVYDLIGHTPPEGPDSKAAAGGNEGMYAMLVLAYTVHKTLFLPVRIGLTAAVTPRLVGWLRQRGWNGADGARRAGREIRERVRRSSRDSDASKD